MHCTHTQPLLINLRVSEFVLNKYITASFDSLLPNLDQWVIFGFATTDSLVDFIIFFRSNIEMSIGYIFQCKVLCKQQIELKNVA